MYINIKTASKIHPSNSILKCAIIPIIDTEVSFGISFGALSLTTTYSVLNLFINRCVEERNVVAEEEGVCLYIIYSLSLKSSNSNDFQKIPLFQNTRSISKAAAIFS